MTLARCIVTDVSCIYTFHTIIALIAFPNTYTRFDSRVHCNNSVSPHFVPSTQPNIFTYESAVLRGLCSPLGPFHRLLLHNRSTFLVTQFALQI